VAEYNTHSVMAISILSELSPPPGWFLVAPPRKDILVDGERVTRRTIKKIPSPPNFREVIYADAMTAHSAFAVHRCRFVDYDPSPITALAFPPARLPSRKGKRKESAVQQVLKFGVLAIGHANGNIDLCEWTGAPGELQSHQAWVVKKVSKCLTLLVKCSLTCK
jgi:hypothetical protein